MHKVFIQKDNKLVVAGIYHALTNQPIVARYGEDGIIDFLFGTNAYSIISNGPTLSSCCIAIQDDGKILVAGQSSNTISPYIKNFALARYLGNPTHPLITKIKTWIRHHILNFKDANPGAAYYAIEQQTGGGSFTQIVTVDASKKEKLKSENEYSFALSTTSNEITRNATMSNVTTSNETTRNEKRETVYRIKAVNKDGSFVYSNLVADNYQLLIINYPL